MDTLKKRITEFSCCDRQCERARISGCIECFCDYGKEKLNGLPKKRTVKLNESWRTVSP